VGGKPGGSAAASKIEPSRANCIGCGGSGGFSVVPRFVGPSSGGGKMAPASGARGGERDGVTNPDSDTAGDPAVNTRKDVDFSRYMAELQRKIKRQWFPPKGPESNRIRVLFQVSRDGTMSGLKLVNSSGNALADKAATNAVETAQPFPPLPAGAPESVDIEFTFDFNVFTR
jgi:TonB family protein